MATYIPHTPAERDEMLGALGLSSLDELFNQIPASVRLTGPLNLPHGMSQMEVLASMKALAAANTQYSLTLRGAGCYDHFIPPIVSRLTSKDEFVTAYTPYQAELSQGILQSIFEYQTLMCELTGMDVSNASVYDGATAAAEAAVMCRDRKRSVILVASTAHPDVQKVISTYCYGSGDVMRLVPATNGVTDIDALGELLADDVACLYVQQPNYFGQLEDVKGLFDLCHAKGVKCVLGANPMTLALLPSGAELGADVVCGDAQPFGLSMSYGGPGVGFMTTTSAMQRRLPGRIVGQTTDDQGRRAFVLTLQAREQHIRREKASSNICSNQAHCALTAAVYLTYMGMKGLGEVAQSCLAKAHAFADKLCAVDGVKLKYDGEFFHEFVTVLPAPAREIETALASHGVLSGLPVGENEMLWCVTEKADMKRLEEVAALVKEAAHK